MAIILHITHQHDWQSALESGAYQTPTLQKDGFIHCSTVAQVLRVANAFYRGQTDLVLLVIDTDKLVAPVKFEAPINPQTGQSEPEVKDLFPHIYGTINLDAVTEVLAFPPNADGTFILPQI
ncbi:MAG: DUF952 domain-containing protein [Anaerolineaceae bacterium]|nr:DUF952 domain-containing protein [Anaerolineaceae bacterium]